jgi:predicted TIM-barrel fold metal-dependent hydrolase
MVVVATPEQSTPRSPVQDVLVSADSHVIEPLDLWTTRLPERLRDLAPKFPARTADRPGGKDPSKRPSEMDVDGVTAEVLYPTLGLRMFGVPNQEFQHAAMQTYNDWLAEYIAAAGPRVVGLAAIPSYDVDFAIRETERMLKKGMRGVTMWQVPPHELNFGTSHYDRLWAALQDLDVSVGLHILSGFTYHTQPLGSKSVEGVEGYRNGVNVKLNDIVNVLFDFIFYGVFDRFPKLQVVSAENEIGWMPWVLQQWDYYVDKRYKDIRPLPLKHLPSEYMATNIWATFFNDPFGCDVVANPLVSAWAPDRLMWSSDYPHGNSTWPESRAVVARQLANLPLDTRANLTWGNAAKLYKLDVPTAGA